MNINSIELGNRIQFYRSALGLSQEQLAEDVSLNVVNISKIERGLRTPSLGTLISIATVLNVTPDQLLADSLPKNKNDLNSLLLECSPEEVSILVENFTGLKKILSKYQIKE